MKKEEILKKKLKDANDFIKSIADMLNIDTEGLGYDGLTLSLDDFQEAIKNLSNELQSVNRNEQKEKVCSCDNKEPYLLPVDECLDCGTLHKH